MLKHQVGIHRTTFDPGEKRTAEFRAVCDTCEWKTSRSGPRDWAQRQALWHSREALKSQEATT